MKQAKPKRWVGLIGVLVFLVACTTATPMPPTATPTPEPADTLNVYNWDDYMDMEIVENFEREFGVTVNYEIFGSNEEMRDVVQAQPQAYDIVVPSDYMVEIMRREGLLAPLDYGNIPNFANLDPAFVNPAYDPGNRYCVAYQWGTMGIGYDISVTKRALNSWGQLFDPAFAGRVAILDDPRASLGAMLLYLGYSPNTTHPQEIAEARDILIEHIDQIALFVPDTGDDLLAAGELVVTTAWNGDMLQHMTEDPDLRYSVPEEGAVIWTDNICVMAQSPHKALAEAFINYLLDPEVGAALSNYTYYATPNQAAMTYIDPEALDNPVIYPPETVHDRLFFLVDVGPDATALYEEAWAEVLAAHGQ